MNLTPWLLTCLGRDFGGTSKGPEGLRSPLRVESARARVSRPGRPCGSDTISLTAFSLPHQHWAQPPPALLRPSVAHVQGSEAPAGLRPPAPAFHPATCHHKASPTSLTTVNPWGMMAIVRNDASPQSSSTGHGQMQRGGGRGGHGPRQGRVAPARQIWGVNRQQTIESEVRGLSRPCPCEQRRLCYLFQWTSRCPEGTPRAISRGGGRPPANKASQDPRLQLSPFTCPP